MTSPSKRIMVKMALAKNCLNTIKYNPIHPFEAQITNAYVQRDALYEEFGKVPSIINVSIEVGE